MKIGDIITVVGPEHELVSGEVVSVAPMKTRAGWHATIIPRRLGEFPNYMLRADREGKGWIYGEDEDAKKALAVANTLTKDDHTDVAPAPRAKSYRTRR